MDKRVTRLAEEVRSFGGSAFLVGGAVRDFMLERPVKDFDVEVFGVNVELLHVILIGLAAEFETKLNLVGESFQVFKLGVDIDVSLPRRDRKNGIGHKGFISEADHVMSFEDACRRRDFTINAMMMDILTGEIIDPFGGAIDLELRNLKMVDKTTFVEDSLRALRAVQFAARFDLDLDPATADTIRTMELDDLPRERLWMEIEKLLMQSPKPSVGLKLLQELGINEKLFPEIHNLVGVPQALEWHPEGDVFVHTGLTVDVAATLIKGMEYGKAVTLVLSAWFHDLGKVETTVISENGKITAFGHAEAGVSLARNMLDRFGLHSVEGYDVRSQILALVEQHMHPAHFSRHPPKASAFRRLSLKVDLELLHLLFLCDSQSRNINDHGVVFDTSAPDWFKEQITTLEIKPDGPDKLLMGRDLIELGMKPGKRMGELLAKVFELQLEGEITTREEALAAARKLDLGGWLCTKSETI